MSTEILKLYLGANRLINPLKVIFSTYRSKCVKHVSQVSDTQSFRPAYACKTPLQRISSGMYGPLRNYCFLARICAPYSCRTSSLHNLGHRTSIKINGSCKNYYLPGFDSAPKGFWTCHALQQADKEKKAPEISEEPVQPEVKLSLFKRYKKMMKEYWYVLLPVHMVTSSVWFVSFYYAATCGFDIVPFLEYVGVGETIIEPFRSSSLGYIAVASALYKIATPARYMVTLGGTTVAINYLKRYGLIKPVPSKARIKSMIQNKFKQQEKQTKENS